jgi:hypothetical protein
MVERFDNPDVLEAKAIPPEPASEICTLHLTLECTEEKDEGLLRDILIQNETLIATHLLARLLSVLEPRYFVQTLSVGTETKDVLVKIGSHRERIGSYDNFAKLIESLLLQQQGELLWLLRGKLGGLRIGTNWYPNALIVRSKTTPNIWARAIEALKHPLVLLLAGSLFGSLLIPRINEQSNQKKLRHEERLKMAISIIEHSHETDRQMSGLMNFLDLFRKDHQVRMAGGPSLPSEQYKAREKFNDMYLAFNAQAWFWHWNIRSESTLSSLATPEESAKITALSYEYTNALLEETQAMSQIWGAFLKKGFNPRDPKYELMNEQARLKQSKARDRRNETAIQMAKVLASQN